MEPANSHPPTPPLPRIPAAKPGKTESAQSAQTSGLSTPTMSASRSQIFAKQTKVFNAQVATPDTSSTTEFVSWTHQTSTPQLTPVAPTGTGPTRSATHARNSGSSTQMEFVLQLTLSAKPTTATTDNV